MDYINQIIYGDCIEIMKTFPDNSVDAVVTDPPYGLEFMGKDWDSFRATRQTKNQLITFLGAGMKSQTRKQLVNFQKWCQDWSTEALRVLKPGGYLLAFGGTRTYHRLVCGIEDAGFEIRDTIMWLYGSGFPKSLDISKAIDKRAEKNLKVIEEKRKLGEWLKEKRIEKCINQKELCELGGFYDKINHGGAVTNWEKGYNLPTWNIWIKLKDILDLDDRYDHLIEGRPKNYIEAEREVIGKHNAPAKEIYQSGELSKDVDITLPATPEAKQWAGWGTALKPACEPIVVARKPLSESTVAENVLKWGTGGIDIDGGRIGTSDNLNGGGYNPKGTSKKVLSNASSYATIVIYNEFVQPQGRFPANVILDEEAGAMLDEMSGVLKSGKHIIGRKNGSNAAFGKELNRINTYNIPSNIGGASRFFYCAKASKSERNRGCEGLPLGLPPASGRSKPAEGRKNALGEPRQNNHPTVKPLALMEYLIKLVSQKGAVILDPFCGSGTTAMGCKNTGRKYIVIDNEKEYIEITKCRVRAIPELLFV